MKHKLVQSKVLEVFVILVLRLTSDQIFHSKQRVQSIDNQSLSAGDFCLYSITFLLLNIAH